MTAGSIRLKAEEGRGRYSIDSGAGEAELTYVIDNHNNLVIDHTYTPPAARGKGLALALVERAVADAAAQRRKVAPQCSYAARVFDDRPDWRLLRAS